MDAADTEGPGTNPGQSRPTDWSSCLRPPTASRRSQPTSLAPPMRPGTGWHHDPARPGALRKRGSQLSTKSSNAERWFDDSNRNVQDDSRPALDDDEPPFYLADRPVSDVRSTACVVDSILSSPKLDTTLLDALPTIQSTMRQLNISENSSDDYRSVIDDLTVENQELRHRLAKYERLHCSHLQHEKLFEVTFHGLSPEKRRDLENALKEFAASVERSSPETASSSDNARQQTSSADGPVNASSTSALRVNREDSGYGSLSISARESATRSPRSSRRPAPRPIQPADRQHVPSERTSDARELRDPQLVTEQKKKLVVRRLEQLFTGKIAQGALAALPLSQQDSSELAAVAERLASGVPASRDHVEGLREARILPLGREMSGDSLEMAQDRGRFSSSSSSSGPSPPRVADSPEQRPTRPRDLDLRRSHHAADNLDYIRHLGISTPTIDHAINAEPTEGWVYLNLLSNMAQLHTLNVTPTFIRDAVSELSTKLQLSEDGRKIRWKGGNQGSRHSESSSDPDPDPDPASTDSAEVEDGQAPAHSRKRKLGRRNSRSAQVVSGNATADGESGLRRPSDGSNEAGVPGKGGNTAAWSTSRDRFSYRPLFFRKESTDDGLESRHNSPSREAPFRATGTGKTNAGSTTAYPAHLGRPLTGPDDASVTGPVIFYKGAKFYTDLSGENTSRSRDVSVGPRYAPTTTEVIGCEDVPESPPSPNLLSRPRRLSWDTPIGTSDGSSVANAEQSGAASPMSFDMDCPSTASEAPEPSDVPEMPPFEVSGLAGVLPADHFVVNVRTHRHARSRKARSSRDDLSRPQDLGGQMRSVEFLRGRKGRARRESSSSDEALSTTWTNLPPSALPPPSCVLHSTSTSSAGSSTRSSSPSPSESSDSSDQPGEYRARPAPKPPLLRAESSLDTTGSSDQVGDLTRSSSSNDLVAALVASQPPPPPPPAVISSTTSTSQPHQRQHDFSTSSHHLVQNSIPPRSQQPTSSSFVMPAGKADHEGQWEETKNETGTGSIGNRKRRRQRSSTAEGNSDESAKEKPSRLKMSKITTAKS